VTLIFKASNLSTVHLRLYKIVKKHVGGASLHNALGDRDKRRNELFDASQFNKPKQLPNINALISSATALYRNHHCHWRNEYQLLTKIPANDALWYS
jgi:hypothetical protein